MRTYGYANLAEFLGDRVVYRNLQPADPGLPGLETLKDVVGLPTGKIPRKSESDYARVVAHLLQTAQSQRGVRAPIRRLLFIGDTHLLDGTAFGNICQAANWPGLAFIGAENTQPVMINVVQHSSGQPLYLANRWAALADFSEYALSHNMPIDETTAAIIDIDKTALGARGRNGQVIDRARVQAIQDTVAALLGTGFELTTFRQTYDLLNQPEFHPFTTDNQDYLAYICLVLGSGLYRLETLLDQVRSGQLVTFEQFISHINDHRKDLPAHLSDIHAEIFANVQAGDPTPFKAFRRNEYLRTIARFNCLEETAPLSERLEQEILITQEVRQAALEWQKRGALLFGLSDKPDEAATPTLELSAQGFQPIHRAITYAAGV
jgi:hypothetical protein